MLGWIRVNLGSRIYGFTKGMKELFLRIELTSEPFKLAHWRAGARLRHLHIIDLVRIIVTIRIGAYLLISLTT